MNTNGSLVNNVKHSTNLSVLKAVIKTYKFGFVHVTNIHFIIKALLPDQYQVRQAAVLFLGGVLGSINSVARASLILIKFSKTQWEIFLLSSNS